MVYLIIRPQSRRILGPMSSKLWGPGAQKIGPSDGILENPKSFLIHYYIIFLWLKKKQPHASVKFSQNILRKKMFSIETEEIHDDQSRSFHRISDLLQ